MKKEGRAQVDVCRDRGRAGDDRRVDMRGPRRHSCIVSAAMGYGHMYTERAGLKRAAARDRVSAGSGVRSEKNRIKMTSTNLGISTQPQSSHSALQTDIHDPH